MDKVIDVFDARVFELSDVQKFRSFYQRTLEAYRPADFRATSIPTAKFFWKDTKTEEVIGQFIKNGGKMKRIFFLDDIGQLQDPEVCHILRRQRELGVDTYTVLASEAPKEWRRFFVVDTEGRIAWELQRAADGTSELASMTWDPIATKRYLELFDRLESLDAVQPYFDTAQQLTGPSTQYAV